MNREDLLDMAWLNLQLILNLVLQLFQFNISQNGICIYHLPTYLFLFFLSFIWVCSPLLRIKPHVRKRKGKWEKDSPNGHLPCSFSQAEEGQYGNCFQLQSPQIFPDSISGSLTLPERVLWGTQTLQRTPLCWRKGEQLLKVFLP